MRRSILLRLPPLPPHRLAAEHLPCIRSRFVLAGLPECVANRRDPGRQSAQRPPDPFPGVARAGRSPTLDQSKEFYFASHTLEIFQPRVANSRERETPRSCDRTLPAWEPPGPLPHLREFLPGREILAFQFYSAWKLAGSLCLCSLH